MANTNILIQGEEGSRVPSLPSVPVVAASEITFTADSGSDSALYFSQSAADVLSPVPQSPVKLPASASVTYTFGSASGQAYGVVVQAPEVAAPESFDFGPPADPARLVIQSGDASKFPGRSVKRR